MNLAIYRKSISNKILDKGDVIDSVTYMISSLWKISESSSIFSEVVKEGKGGGPLRPLTLKISRAITTSSKTNIGGMILENYSNIENNFKKLSGQIDTTFKDKIDPNGTTLKQLNLLALIDLGMFFIRYTNKLMVETSRSILANSKGKKDYIPTKYRFKFLNDNFKLYTKIFDLFALNQKEFSKQVNEAPSLLITSANVDMLAGELPSKVKTALGTAPNGFIGNPFIWARRVFQGTLDESYSEINDHKRYLEATLVAVRQEANGKTSPSLQKEINSIEERIKTAEFKLSKIMEA